MRDRTGAVPPVRDRTGAVPALSCFDAQFFKHPTASQTLKVCTGCVFLRADLSCVNIMKKGTERLTE